MTSQSQRAIAAENMRRRIPDAVMLMLNDMTNEALASVGSDTEQHPEFKAFAQWELEYREAFGILVDWEPEEYVEIDHPEFGKVEVLKDRAKPAALRRRRI